MTEEARESTTSGNEEQQPARGMAALVAHISTHRVDFALWCTRFMTIIFTLSFFIPLFGSPSSAYSKVLLSNAATSALRLHQRLPRVQLTRDFFTALLLEDSAHYLMYSLLFLSAAPFTVALIPPFLFALLHICSTSLQLADLIGPVALSGLRVFIALIEMQSANILKTIAFTEIFLMPSVVVMIFGGRASLLTVFMYYRFLTLRYASRRNPYSRNTFSELRLLVESLAARPVVPRPIADTAHKVIALVCRLAPPVAPPAAQ
uniref:EOG090X0CJA n=1 Tax=Lynceus sp. MCZ IZ 141354 TaxID=1930659 RepID=A0A9N6WUD4_9CRUS|nr:EOG090X0CJA [Lynceus sp. MCZ IZ 141354]